MPKTVNAPKKRARTTPVHKANEKVFTQVEYTLFKNLRLLREESGLTQEKWAAALNINHNYVRGYEAGRFLPSLPILLLIADFRRVSVDWLLGRTKVRDLC